MKNSIEQRAIDIARRYGVSPALDDDDHMLNEFLRTDPSTGLDFYFAGGQADATELIKHLSTLSGLPEKPNVMEFAAGYGRLTRHLVLRVGPHFATLAASDIHPKAVELLKNKLGVSAYLSHDTPDRLALPISAYDYVFAMSLFSHLPHVSFARWIRALLSLADPNGYVMFTTHGPGSYPKSPGLPQIGREGIGFMTASEQRDLDNAIYGATVVTPEYVERQIKSAGGTLISYEPLAWWGLQDQYTIRKQ